MRGTSMCFNGKKAKRGYKGVEFGVAPPLTKNRQKDTSEWRKKTRRGKVIRKKKCRIAWIWGRALASAFLC